MLGRRALRRAVVVTGLSSVLLGALPVGARAAAAGGVDVDNNPAAAANTVSDYVLLLTPGDAFLPAPASAPTVTLSRNAQASDQVTGTAVSVDSTTGQITAHLDLVMANPGSYDVNVTNGVVTDSCSACFTLLSGAPTVSGVSPNTLGMGGTTSQFVISGTEFAKGPYDGATNDAGVALFLTGTSTPDPAATLSLTTPTPTAPTSTSITLTLQLAPGTTAHDDDVVVTNTDGTSSAPCVGCLHVEPQPTISSIALSATGDPSIGQNATGQQIVITGSGFQSDAAVSVVPPSQSAGTITFHQNAPNLAGTQITLDSVDTSAVTASGTTSANLWALSVTNTSWHSTSAASDLTVNPAPTATSISYPDGSAPDVGQGATSRTVSVHGDNIESGAVVRFTGLPPTVSVTDLPATPAVTGGAASATLDVPEDATVTTYAAKVLNPDGGTSAECTSVPAGVPPSSTPCPLTVAAGPSIIGVTPSAVVAPYTGGLVVTGANLHTTADQVRVTLSSGGTTYYSGEAQAVDQSNGTQTVTLPGSSTSGSETIPAGAALGAVTVTVTNLDDGGTKTATTSNGANLLTVANLLLTGVTPSFALNDGTVTGVQISGQGFAPDATVLLRKGGLDDIPGTVGSVAGDGTSLTADFDLTNVGPGTYQIVVTNPTTQPGQAANSSVVFSVIAANTPTTTSVTPQALGGGATNVPVTVTGANFYPGSTVSFANAAITPAICNAAPCPPVINADGTQITQLVDVAGNATTGTSTVTVTDSANDASNSQTVTVDPAPLVTGVTPANHSPDAFSLGVAGAGFVPGATLAFDTSGVHASNVVVAADGSSLTADLTFDAGVVPSDAPVDVAVTVINPDYGQATTASGHGLQLDPEPRITTVTSPVPAGKSTPIVLTGANFLPGASVTAPGQPGVTVTSFTFNNVNEIDAVLTVDAGAARGVRTLTVDNGDGGTATKDVTVYVVPGAPQAPAAPTQTVTPGDSSLTLSWQPPADDGGSAITGYVATVTEHGAASSNSYPLGSTSTSFTFPGLTNGTLYDVSVVASNGAGNGAPLSGSDTPRTVPGVPTNLAVTAGNGSLSLSWDPPVDDGGNAVSGYTATVTPHSGGSPVSSTGASTSRTVTGLTNGVSYDVSVVATNAAGAGASATASGIPFTVPGAPTAVSVVPGDGALAVSWSAPASDGGRAADHYTVTVTPHAGGTATTFTTPDGATLSHPFTGLTNGALYDVTVTAHNAAGDGAAASGSGTPVRASDAPSIRNIVPGDGTLSVTWAAPSANGGAAVSSYTVTVAPHAGGTATTFTTPDATATSHTFGGLTNGTVYDVSVAANNSAGPSAATTGSATPRFASTLTIADTRHRVVYGTKITLSGLLTRSDGQPVAGGSVRLFRTLDGRTAAVYRTLTTDGTGRWSTTFAPAFNASYFAGFVGDAAVSPATSGAARTLVAPRVRIWSPLNRSTSSSASVLRVTGKVAPNKAGRVVVLYYVTRTHRLVKLTASRLSARSTFVLRYRLKRGTWHLRVVIGRSPGNVYGSSPTLTVRRT
jgi:hypothetical protein